MISCKLVAMRNIWMGQAFGVRRVLWNCAIVESLTISNGIESLRLWPIYFVSYFRHIFDFDHTKTNHIYHRITWYNSNSPSRSAYLFSVRSKCVYKHLIYTNTSACRCDTFRSSSFYLFILFVRMEYRNENKTSNNLIKIVRYFTLSPNSCWCGCGQFHADTHIIFRDVIRFACTTRTSSVEKYAQEWDPIEFIRWTNAPESIFTFVFFFFASNRISCIRLYICISVTLRLSFSSRILV